MISTRTMFRVAVAVLAMVTIGNVANAREHQAPHRNSGVAYGYPLAPLYPPLAGIPACRSDPDGAECHELYAVALARSRVRVETTWTKEQPWRWWWNMHRRRCWCGCRR